MTADEIVAGVLAQPTAMFSPGVRTLVAEIVVLRADLELLRYRERICDSKCGPIQFVAGAWHRAEEEFDLPDDDPYSAIVRLREAQQPADAVTHEEMLVSFSTALAKAEDENIRLRKELKHQDVEIGLFIQKGTEGPADA